MMVVHCCFFFKACFFCAGFSCKTSKSCRILVRQKTFMRLFFPTFTSAQSPRQKKKKSAISFARCPFFPECNLCFLAGVAAPLGALPALLTHRRRRRRLGALPWPGASCEWRCPSSWRSCCCCSSPSCCPCPRRTTAPSPTTWPTPSTPC